MESHLVQKTNMTTSLQILDIHTKGIRRIYMVHRLGTDSRFHPSLPVMADENGFGFLKIKKACVTKISCNNLGLKAHLCFHLLW